MKMGFVSAILDGWTYEEMMDTAREMGFKCGSCQLLQGKGTPLRGVSHVDAERARLKTRLMQSISRNTQKNAELKFLLSLLSQHDGCGSCKAGSEYRTFEECHPGEREARHRNGYDLHRKGSDEDR